MLRQSLQGTSPKFHSWYPTPSTIERERERKRERDKERETKRGRESERERAREKEPVEESLDSPPEAHPRDIAENLPESGAVGGGSEQPLYKNVQWFRGGLIFEAHRLLYHSASGSRIF